MLSNLDGDARGGLRFGYGCFKGERLDSERKNLVGVEDMKSVGVEDMKSDDGSPDIADLLPSDPFEMEFNITLPNDPFGMDFNISLPKDPFGMEFSMEATVAAISGWFEDFGLKTYGFEGDEAHEDENNDDSKVFGELNFIWTRSMNIDKEEGENVLIDSGSVVCSEDGQANEHDILVGEKEDFMFPGCKSQNEALSGSNSAEEGAPADAIFFALGHLGVRDLLSVESVCKSLRDTVREDPLLWRNIVIDYPLSDIITDDDLAWLTNRAQGTLHSLSLLKCLKITGSGLKHVLLTNPQLTKLSVPGCIKLSAESVFQYIKIFNSVARPGIKRLRIGDLSGLTDELFREFKLLLGANEDKKVSNSKPRFYGAGQLYLSLDDEQAFDVETCPSCEKARQVYDCPAESCQEKIHSTNPCRACISCIARCICCGCCLDDKAYEETFCLESLCFDCLTQLFDCPEKWHYLQGTITFTRWHVTDIQ